MARSQEKGTRRLSQLLDAAAWGLLAICLVTLFGHLETRREAVTVGELTLPHVTGAAQSDTVSLEARVDVREVELDRTVLVLCLPESGADRVLDDPASWSLSWYGDTDEVIGGMALDAHTQAHALDDGRTCVVMPPERRGGDTLRVRLVGPLLELGDATPTLVAVSSPPHERTGLLACVGLLLAMLLRLAAWTLGPAGKTLDGWRPYDGFVGVLLVLLFSAAATSALSPAPSVLTSLLGALEGDAPGAVVHVGPSVLGMFLAAMGHVAVYIGLCWAYAAVRTPAAREGLGIRGVSRSWALGPYVAGMVLALVANSLLFFFAPERPSTMQWLTVVPGTMLVTAAIACLSPWFEELFFRGFLFSAVEGVGGRTVAAMVSGGLFALAHVPQHLGYLVPLVPIVAVAAGTSWLRWRTGSVVPAFALHLGYNTLLVIPALLM